MRRNRFFTVNDVGVQEQSFSGYWGQQIFFTDWLRFEGGLRGDVFFFDVDNRLPQPGPRSELRPRATSNGNTTDGLREPEGEPDPDAASRTPTSTSTSASGFHSNDARAPSSAPSPAPPTPATGVPTAAQSTPLAKALGYEVGARTRQFDRLDVAAALWLLDLDSELVFSGDAGTDEPSPRPSRRWGVDFEARYQITAGCSPTTT